jgi:hypothetical protein
MQILVSYFRKFPKICTIRFDQLSHSEWHKSQVTKYVPYSAKQEKLIDFANWLSLFTLSDKFITVTNAFITTEMQLLNERVGVKKK